MVRFVHAAVQIIFVVQVKNDFIDELKILFVCVYQVHLVGKIVSCVPIFVYFYVGYLLFDTYCDGTVIILMEALDKRIADQGYLVLVATGLEFPMRIESRFIDMELREILVPVSRYCMSRIIRHPFFNAIVIDKPWRVFGIQV